MRPRIVPFIAHHSSSSLIRHTSYLNTMPIIINELHVKARVSEQGTGQQQVNNGSTSNSADTNGQNTDAEQVKKSVDAILDVLKRKNER
jgi:Family of unknown function (DUF5908)